MILTAVLNGEPFDVKAGERLAMLEAEVAVLAGAGIKHLA